ncbi:MAG: MBL fold metallo-hydrolase [Candidatus Bipolaricaulota bacterium]
MVDIQRVDEGLWMLDVEQFGVTQYASVYLLAGDDPALVETGTSLEVGHVLAGLQAAGVSPGEIAWIFVTHVHLDHAGGAGTLLSHMPRARVVVHARGARYLQDPTKLLASVRQATGHMADKYGTAEPIPPERIVTPDDGDVFDLGERRLRAVDTPGHAPHHLCYFEEGAGWLFTGDAAGTWRKGMLLPTTPPPNFDLQTWLSTIERLETVHPKMILYTHFGANREAQSALQSYRKVLADWVERVEGVWRGSGRDVEATVRALLEDPELQSWPYNEHAPQAELEICVRGVVHYLNRREAEGE